MSSWVILAFKGVIIVILPTLITTSSLLMSHSLRIPPSPLQRLLLFRMSCLFLVFTSLDFPSPPTSVITRPLKVYTRRPRPPTRPLVESSFMPQSSLAPVSQPSDDLPIAIQKGTCSTSNPHPIYNFLSFHHLSLPYFAFVSTLSSVSTPKSTSEALSHPGWK